MDAKNDSRNDPQDPQQKRLKVMYLITKSNWGGAQRYVYDLATSLDKGRFDAVVAFGQAGTLKTKLDEAGIRTIQIPSLERNINLIKEWKSFTSLVALFRNEKPDVIHLNSSKIGGLGAFAGRLAGIRRIIFTGHGWAFNEERSAAQKTLILFLHWITILLTHSTIVVSEKIRNQMSWMPFIGGKMRIIHNGTKEIDFLSQAEARQALQIEYEAESKDAHAPLIVGTISELHKNKGLDFLIEAMAEAVKEPSIQEYLHGFKVVIIGDGEERERLEELIARKGLQRTVILKGYVADAKKYLKAFDIFTLTSRTEALPYAVLEAGMASLPVLASAVGGIPEIIHQLQSGILVKAGDIKEIRDGLIFLIKEREKRMQLGRVLRNRIETTFNFQKMLAATERLYFPSRKYI